ncbi:hypothetical protein [Acidianus sp.]|uniref:hypothetical protein n=1 Tax=Acidianus sp. TaxID=1872104 RepID=UPI00397D03B1
MQCSDLLKLVVEGKIDKEIGAYYDCFLSLQHFLRFNVALKLKRKVIKIGNYVYFDLDYDRPSSFISGIDDTTGKIFTMPVRMCGIYYETEEEIRKCMGFDYHYYEKFEYATNVKIRIQGDLVMDVIRAYDKKEELFKYINENKENFRQLWESFVRAELGKNKEMQNAEVLIGTYQELMDFALNTRVYKEEDRKDVIKVVKLLRMLENDILTIAKKYGIEVHNLYEKPRSSEPERYKCIRFLDIQEFARKLREKKAEELSENFNNFVLNQENTVKIRIGHYTTPHEISLTGVITDVVEGRRVNALILSPQKITVKHPEHGVNEFYVPKPSYVQFRLMEPF